MIYNVGHAAIDYIFHADAFPSVGKTSYIKEYYIVFGGAAANGAVTVARLGEKSGLVTMAGDDFESSGYASYLQKQGIDLAQTQRVSGVRQPGAFMFNASGRWVSYFYWGASAKFKEAKPPKLDGLVHLANGDPAFAISVAKQAKKKVSFDPGHDWHAFSKQQFEEIFPLVEYYFVNKEEFANVGWTLERLFDAGVRVVCVSDGERGSVLHTQSETINIPAFKTKTVDPTGCGDAYRPAFLIALQKDMSLLDAGLFASAVASFVVEKQGPQEGIPTYEQAVERMELMRNEV